MKVLLVARDVAPSNTFKKLGIELEKRGAEVVSFLGGGQEITPKNGLDAAYFAGRPCVVLTGMSSSASLAKDEVAAIESAHSAGNPIGCYADAFRAFTRPWFAHLRDKIDFLFTLNEGEAIAARELFPKARVVASGNPNWDEFFAPKMSREEARAKLGVADGRKVMFCLAAGKNLAANMGHFVNMVSAAVRLSKDADREWHLVFSLHPGDEDLDGHYKVDQDLKKKTGEIRYVNIPNIYADFKKYSRVPVTIASKSLITTTDGLSAADVVIDSGSTSGIEAVARNIPVVAFITEVQWNRIHEQSASRSWPTIDQGCVPLTEDVGELAHKINSLLFDGEFERKYLPRQKECYPKPDELGMSLRTMTDTILKLIS